MNARLLRKLDDFAELLTEQLEQRKFWLLGGLSILYLLITCSMALRKPLWNDELFTYYLAVLPRVSDLWSALLSGGEQTPPLVHLATRASVALFGANHLAIRLPEVLGFWVMSLCLFQFVSKRSSALYGFVAMLFPLATAAYDLAIEARAYALVLGFGGLALLYWQAATETEGYARTRVLIGLAASLAAAVSSHYYAVLLFVPLMLGQGVHSWSRRRLDLPTWLALGLAMTPLLLHLPLIRAAHNEVATFWAQPSHYTRPSWSVMVRFYGNLLTPAVLPLVAMLMLSALYSMPESTTPRREMPPARPGLTLYEMAAAWGFTSIPVVAIVAAKLVTGVFGDRYVLTAVIGFSILLAGAAASMRAGRALLGVALVLSLLLSAWGGTITYEIWAYRRGVPPSRFQARVYEFLQSERETDLPIVVSDSHTFMQLAYYAPPELAPRLVYLADPKRSLRYLGESSADQNLLQLKPWFPVKIERYGPYVASQRRFLVYGHLHRLNWLLYDLIRGGGIQIELRGRQGNNLLFLVSANGKSTTYEEPSDVSAKERWFSRGPL